jgi:hypothetical protein
MFNKAKLGYFSLMHLPPGDEAAYNHWHRYDHMPEVISVPGIHFGQRFVATPDCLSIRTAATSALAQAQYFTYYLFGEPITQTLRAFKANGTRLRAEGRQQSHEPAAIGGPFLLIKAWASPRVLVSARAVPYRPNKGIYAVVTDLLDSARQQDIAGWYDRVHIPDMLTVEGIAGAYWFISTDYTSALGFGENPLWRSIFIYYLDGDPVSTAARLKEHAVLWRRAGRLPDHRTVERTLLAGPYRSISSDAAMQALPSFMTKSPASRGSRGTQRHRLAETFRREV